VALFWDAVPGNAFGAVLKMPALFGDALAPGFSSPRGRLSEKRYAAPPGAVLQALANFPSNATD
jgi:hypothetical protein